MGIRQRINEKPALAIGLTAGVVAVALLFVVWHSFGGRHQNRNGTAEAFYSDDDGKTWFIDAITKVPPFDHDGKQAVHAAVFRCGTDKPFVAYLQRFPAAGKAKIEAGAAKDPGILQMLEYQTPMEAKKPGDAGWVPGPGADYQKVVAPVCPDGSPNLIPVSPADPDSGAVR